MTASDASSTGASFPFTGEGPHLFTDLADTPTSIEWVVDGLISTGSVIIAAGSPKLSKKSWTMMHLACCVAGGTPFFGRKVARRPVIYTFMEDGPRRVAARLSLLTTVRGLDRHGPPAGIPAAYFGSDGFNKVNGMIRSLGPCLWIIDPLIEVVHALKLDENSSTEMSEFMSVFRTTVQSTQSSIMLVHHFSKQGLQMRGSSALEGACDGWWNFVPMQTKGRVSVSWTLRDGEDGKLGFELQTHGNQMRMIQCDSGGEKDETDVEAVRQAMARFTDTVPARDLTAELQVRGSKLSEARVKAALTRMVERGMVIQSGRGSYQLTDAGKGMGTRSGSSQVRDGNGADDDDGGNSGSFDKF